ncbi:hypothetical protein G7Y89_g10161 [Cudoniella acicularis]|uniref:FAD-binding domain-containing protein n=1 Tax=Cudoniella acicularis TaxID=354080 RepID=A0A8H4W1W8_9HELO|nr:hypothetical protein G7Y89_g10161 [Cudoniella acicularis]
MDALPFRVIIVGAGPTGLALGNMLIAANIDFVILERHKSVITESGACIMLWPHATRILDQLGLLKKGSHPQHIPLHSKIAIDHRGSQISNDPTFQWIEENHGYAPMHLIRPHLTSLLYDGFEKHRGKIKTSVYIYDIEMNETGVRVKLQDGSVENGSIVIGCDGVHSQTRNIMQKYANMAGIAIDEEPKVATYQCLYGSAASIPGITKSVFWESHGPGVATQFANLGDRSHFSLLKRLKEPISEHHVFSTEETTNFFKEIGETLITSSLKAKDLQQHCTWTRLAYQPEGSLKRWYHNRIVLCGESTTQMTSIAGMGFNTALQSAVVLANKLHKTLQSNSQPDMNVLTGVFKEYQEIRQIETQIASKLSASYVRAVTWSSCELTALPPGVHPPPHHLEYGDGVVSGKQKKVVQRDGGVSIPNSVKAMLMPFSLPPAKQAAILNGPALAPPPGVVPNLEHPPNNDLAIHIPFAVFLALVTIAVFGRMYIRFIHLKQPFIGDYLVLLGYAFFLTEYALVYRMTIVPGSFVHQWNVRMRDLTEYLHIIFISSVIYNFTILPVKVAVLLEWLRIFSPTGTRNLVFWASHFLIWANVIFYMSTVIALNVSCTPYEFIWNKLIPGNCKAVDYKLTDLSVSVFNFTSDVLILLIPQHAIWKLQMLSRKKIGVSLVFAIGLFACGAALARLVETVKHQESMDFTYTFTSVQLCSGVEMTCAFLVICVPSFPKAFQAMKESKLKSFWTSRSSQKHLRSTSGKNSGEGSWPRSHSQKFSKLRPTNGQDSSIDGHQLSSISKLKHNESAEQSLHPYDIGQAERGIVQTTDFEVTEGSQHSSNALKDPYDHHEQWN